MAVMLHRITLNAIALPLLIQITQKVYATKVFMSCSKVAQNIFQIAA